MPNSVLKAMQFIFIVPHPHKTHRKASKDMRIQKTITIRYSHIGR